MTIIARLVAPRRSEQRVVRPVVDLARLQADRLATLCNRSSIVNWRIRAALSDRWSEVYTKERGGCQSKRWHNLLFEDQVRVYTRSVVLQHLRNERAADDARNAVLEGETDIFPGDLPLAGSMCSSRASEDFRLFKSKSKRLPDGSNGPVGPRTSPKRRRNTPLVPKSTNRWSASTYSTKAESQMSLVAPTEKAVQEWVRMGPSFLASYHQCDEPMDVCQENIDPYH